MNYATANAMVLLGETERLRQMLREAAITIEELAEQQAMPDESYLPVLNRIRAETNKGGF